MPASFSVHKSANMHHKEAADLMKVNVLITEIAQITRDLLAKLKLL